jgi:hypothetical protein
MKYSKIIKSIDGAGILLGSFSVMDSGFGGSWSRDSHAGTLMNANAPSYQKQPILPATSKSLSTASVVACRNSSTINGSTATTLR